MVNFIIPIITLIIILYGFFKRVNIYDEFLLGIEEGLKLIISIFPTIMAMAVSVNILVSSGIIYDISNILTPFVFKI